MDDKKTAQFRRQNDFIKNNYDRVNLTLPKGKKEEIKSAAAALGMSTNEYILKAIDSMMSGELSDSNV